MSAIGFGLKCRDTVTGFVGVCTGRAEYLGTDSRWLLEAPATDRGINEVWFNESRVEVVDEDTL